MATLTIDDTTYAKLAERAECDGMTVEAWIARRVFEGTLDAENDPPVLTGRAWERAFEEYLSTRKIRNPGMDDSRESMYPVRG